MIVTPLLQLAANKQASDLFFSVGAPVNIKIDGITMPVNAQILDADVVKRIAYEMMSPKQIAEFETHLEMNFSFRAEGIGNFRVNVFRQRGDIAIVIRYIRARIGSSEELQPARDTERTGHGKARTGAGGRRDRLRKIHHPGLHDRASQQLDQRPYPDHRRTDRILSSATTNPS